MDRRVRTGVGIFWALLPFLTLGLAVPVVFGYAAVRRRTAAYWITAAMYLVLFVVMLISAGTPEDSAVGDSVFTVVFLFAWLGGTIHAFLVRSQVFASPPTATFQDAIDDAEQRRNVRRQARKAAEDPAMAWELRIGRPDLPRRFDDGGLVDVNHVPPQVLAELPGMTPELVSRVVRVREQCGGFDSVEELSALAQLPQTLAPQLGEFTIFLP
jgi:hypothetical protein